MECNSLSIFSSFFTTSDSAILITNIDYHVSLFKPCGKKSGNVAIGTTTTTGAGAGDVVLKNTGTIRGVNSSGDGTIHMIDVTSGNRVAIGSDVTTFEVDKARTLSVGTSATTIYTNTLTSNFNHAYLLLVSGVTSPNTDNTFFDLIMTSAGGIAPTVIASTYGNAPAGRTYTTSGGSVQLAMSSGTYNVNVVAFRVSDY